MAAAGIDRTIATSAKCIGRPTYIYEFEYIYSIIGTKVHLLTSMALVNFQ